MLHWHRHILYFFMYLNVCLPSTDASTPWTWCCDRFFFFTLMHSRVKRNEVSLGIRENRPWHESLMILWAFLMHLLQCGGQFKLPFVGFFYFCCCCFPTRQWCSPTVCFPKCRCKMSGGCGDSFPFSSAVWGKRGVVLPSSAQHLLWASHVRSSEMWYPKNVKLLTRSTGVPSMMMGVYSC